jgi:BirA family transcriptional regulator, biotin operon repressor / biotin---[acetyl-CoA-carboxylase] ligase
VTGADPTAGAISRLERFGAVGSTNDIVRSWLADGEPEVCVAVADQQTAGRGREGRVWAAPPGAALLLSCGFRPTWLPADRVWRLGAAVSLAMCDASEEVAGLPEGTIRLKWPNDLVVEAAGPNALLTGIASVEEASARLASPLELRKVAGVLGESTGLGTGDPQVVVGIGVNADWPAREFPPDLAGTMTSLREASAGRPINRDALLDAFLGFLETRLDALHAAFFDLQAWAARQVLTGRLVRLSGPPGADSVEWLVNGVDGASGALVATPVEGGETLLLHAAEVVRVRLAARTV